MDDPNEASESNKCNSCISHIRLSCQSKKSNDNPQVLRSAVHAEAYVDECSFNSLRVSSRDALRMRPRCRAHGQRWGSRIATADATRPSTCRPRKGRTIKSRGLRVRSEAGVRKARCAASGASPPRRRSSSAVRLCPSDRDGRLPAFQRDQARPHPGRDPQPARHKQFNPLAESYSTR